MGKAATPRKIKDNEAMAYGKVFMTSPQKLNWLAQTIRANIFGEFRKALGRH